MSRRFLALLALVGAIAVLTSGCTAVIIQGPTVSTRTPIPQGSVNPTGSVTPSPRQSSAATSSSLHSSSWTPTK
jgi:hypothetical protein